MGPDETFDEFYRATRRALVHQTFALVGDLGAAQSSVRDAYIAAWHHWRKVSSYDDPLEWVRPRAWQLAQRRHTARLWHRAKGIPAEERDILSALGKLAVGPRKVLLLTHLAAVSLPQAAKEVGVTGETAERHLQTATANFATTLDVDSVTVRPRLEALADTAGEAQLPRASIIRRAGRKRRQSHTVVAAAVATVAAIASGAFVYQPSEVQASDIHRVKPSTPAAPASPVTIEDEEPELPSAEELLDKHQIQRLGTGQEWTVTSTHDNTTGDGINTICQEARFADPDGIAAVVREFEAGGKPPRSAVQTIEISESPQQAAGAFETTVGWYAGCRVGRLQLLTSYRVDGIGDEASVLMMRVWDRPVTTYSVAVSRIGQVVTSTVGKSVGAQPPPAREITQSLADSVSMLCGTSGEGDCASTPTFSAVPPPPSGEENGLLAVADLPPVGRIDEPWVGTQASPARVNPSATVCDRANFVRSGAQESRTRTFLIPGARLPDRFGLSETYGVFDSRRAANQFIDGVSSRMADCEDDHLAVNVLDSETSRPSKSPIALFTWRMATEVSEDETVEFRVGFVRVRNKVAQLTFAPTDQNDVSGKAFGSLLTRAGERLQQLR